MCLERDHKLVSLSEMALYLGGRDTGETVIFKFLQHHFFLTKRNRLPKNVCVKW